MSLSATLFACALAVGGTDVSGCVNKETFWSLQSNPDTFRDLKHCQDEAGGVIRELVTDEEAREDYGFVVPPKEGRGPVVLYYRCFDKGEVVFDSLLDK